MKRLSRSLLALAASAPLAAVPACGDDKAAPTSDVAADTTADTTADTADDTTDPGDVADDVTPPLPSANAVFRSNMLASQSIFAGAFPNDTLRDEEGIARIAPLATDPVFSKLGNATALGLYDQLIQTRNGFGFASAAFFPMEVAPDLATFAGRVEYRSVAGPDVGARFPAQLDWFEAGKVLVVLPAWGHAMVPGSTYAITIGAGVKDVEGRTLETPPDVAGALAATAPEGFSTNGQAARDHANWALLRTSLGDDADDIVMATVFTTQESLPWLNGFFDAVDAFELVPPTSHVASSSKDSLAWVDGLDLHGDALEAHFGTPTGTFAYFPTHWPADLRASAANVPGETEAYAGGAYHDGIGRLIQGSLAMPLFNQKPERNLVVPNVPTFVDGAPVAAVTGLVPFSAYFCSSHLVDPQTGVLRTDSSVKFAIFTHGGTEVRAQALSFAVSNCRNDVATIVLDLPYHGGRQDQRYFADEELVVPVQADIFNTYNGAAEPDGVGDAGASTTSVGGLFGLPSNFDPRIIEANLTSIAAETRLLLRYLRDTGANGLGAYFGIEVDADNVMLQSLSFGTNFTIGVWALDDSVSHVVTSVGSGQVLSVNLPMAPANAGVVTTILDLTLGLANDGTYLARGAWRDPAIAILQWLCERGDPLAYAPFVVRHRPSGTPPHILATGNSWDETLFGPAQTTLNNALGLPVFENAEAGWRLSAAMPGASTVTAAAYPENDVIADNVDVDGTPRTMALFYNSASCHAHITSPYCTTSFESNYPPAVPRAEALRFISPICAVHEAVISLGDSFANGGTASFAPLGTTSCTDLYMPR
jgi:hypothetical protein